MSFCRITGRSRNLPKPHYFPLIPPMSPADAQRICRITGKAHGLPMHHYMPVLPRRTQPLAKCRITKVADVYGKRKHYPVPGFKYLRPIIDLKQTKQLVNLLAAASGEEPEGEFVYTVKERKYSLMFPANLERAVRSGDIKDVMLANDSRQVLLKMKIGEDISLKVKEVKKEEYLNKEDLYEGEGVAAEEVHEEEVVKEEVKEKVENRMAVMVSSEDWRNLIQPLLEGCDWNQFEEEAAKGMSIAKWNPPAPGTARTSKDFQRNQKILTPIEIIQRSLHELTPNDLESTRNIFEKLQTGGKHILEKLPILTEIQEIVTKLAKGTYTDLVQIPGLSVSLEKTKFIIGQMIGKIFVPGQTVNSGNHFLPGFVVNTVDGPALVPGLVVSKQRHSSIFLPGEMIDEFVPGQKLILCKDLDGYEERIRKELEEKALEENIKKELEEKVHPELKVFMEKSIVDCVLNTDIAKMVAVKYDFDSVDLENLSKIVLIITHFAENLPEITNDDNQQLLNNQHCDILKNALLTAVRIIQDDTHHATVYNSIIEIFANLQNRSNVITDLCNYLNNTDCELLFSKIVEANNHMLPNVSKMDILKSALRPNATNIIEKLSTVIEEDLLAPAFQNVSYENTEFVEKVLARIQFDGPITDEQAYELLQIAIVDAIKEISESKLSNFLANETVQAITELLQEAIGLAVALGMSETADSLLKVIQDPASIHLIADDPLTLEILKRLTVMRQIAEKQPQLNGALHELKLNPLLARTNPQLRELVRESAVLMVPDVPNLKTSEHIPTRLFQVHNTLAMEDFVTRNRQPGTLMIIKRGLQAVVPKEASRAVLNGQVAYTLIDETGISHFKPMDVFSALRLSRPTVLRFSGYECLGACEESRRVSNADKVKDFTNRLLACF